MNANSRPIVKKEKREEKKERIRRVFVELGSFESNCLFKGKRLF